MMTRMQSKRVPPVAWILSAGTAVALLVLAVPPLHTHGPSWFFHEGDAYLYRATARDLFGKGRAFAPVNRVPEIPYRYGRMGLPFLAWLLVLGRPGAVEWPLVGIHLAAIAAIPGLGAVLLDDYGAPPIGAAAVLLVPGLLVIYDKVYADTLLIADSSIKDVPAPDQATLEKYLKDHAELYQSPEYRKLTILRLQPDAVAKTIKISDAAIAAEFDKNKDAYATPETRQFLTFTLPDEAKAQAAAKEISDGTDFAVEAKKATGSDVIDTGLVSRDGLLH